MADKCKQFRKSNQVTVYLVQCKENPQSKLQYWIPHLDCIFSECSVCKTRTDYGNTPAKEHYSLFTLTDKRRKGEGIVACMDRLENTIRENPKEYLTDWNEI